MEGGDGLRIEAGEELADPALVLLAIAANVLLPFGVRRTIQARRSAGLASRLTRPSRASSSVRPVTLPPVTIRRRESSLILRPSLARSSCAM